MLKKYIFHLAVVSFLACASASAINPASAGAESQTVGGTVLETMNAAGYTYLYIDSGTAKSWVAVPETAVAAGDTVSYSQGMQMKNFHSKSLDRTFPTITFSSGLTNSPAAQSTTPQSAAAPANDSFSAAVAREQQAASATAPVMAETTAGSAGAIAPFKEIQIAKAAGDNSYTVAEIFSQAKELNGKTIRLQGKVVKYNANIMGRNWLHLQDGTGDPMNNTHDLVITTSEQITDEEVIIIEGKLAADKDFGAGYKYAAIVEEALIIK